MPLGRQVLSGPPKVASGQRDKQVTIQGVTDSVGTSGFPTETWADLDPSTEWMYRRDLRADERFVSNQQSAFAETTWQSSYRADLDPELVDVAKKRRFVYLGRVHNIVAAALMERKIGIEFMTLSGGTLQ